MYNLPAEIDFELWIETKRLAEFFNVCRTTRFSVQQNRDNAFTAFVTMISKPPPFKKGQRFPAGVKYVRMIDEWHEKITRFQQLITDKDKAINTGEATVTENARRSRNDNSIALSRCISDMIVAAQRGENSYDRDQFEALWPWTETTVHGGTGQTVQN